MHPVTVWFSILVPDTTQTGCQIEFASTIDCAQVSTPPSEAPAARNETSGGKANQWSVTGKMEVSWSSR
jgi:hypothetical protein